MSTTKLDSAIAERCCNQIPAVPPSTTLKIGDVLTLNADSVTASKGSANMRWFAESRFNMARVFTDIDICRKRQDFGDHGDVLVGEIRVRDLATSVKAAVFGSLGLGGAASSNMSHTITFRVKKLQDKEASDAFQNHLIDKSFMTQALSNARLKHLLETKGGTLGVVHGIYTGEIEYEASASNAKSSSGFFGISGPEGAGAKAKLTASDKSAVLQSSSFPPGATVACKIHLYRAAFFEGKLFMAPIQSIFHFQEDSKHLRSAASWMKLGPLTKLTPRKQFIKLKGMKKCGQYVATAGAAVVKFDDAMVAAADEAKSCVGIDYDTSVVKGIGGQFKMSHHEDLDFAVASTRADVELRKHTHAPTPAPADPDGKYIDDEEMKNDDEESDDETFVDFMERTLNGSVLLIRHCDRAKLLELYTRWQESTDGKLQLGDGWVLEEIRICFFFDVHALGLSPVTLGKGEDIETAPGCVIRSLDNGALLTIPVSGGPEKIVGSQQRVYGNGDALDRIWKIEVSTEYVNNDDDGTSKSLSDQGYMEVKREEDDMDISIQKDCRKMMRYTLESREFSGVGVDKVEGTTGGRQEVAPISPDRAHRDKKHKRSEDRTPV